MAVAYFICALIIQSSLTFASNDDNEEQLISREILDNKLDMDDDIINEYNGDKQDWMGMFMLPNSGMFPSSSATLMSQVTNSNKTAEEQLEDIKEIANEIKMAIQNEMVNLLAYCVKESEGNNSSRKKRSVETPMDSTQLVMRLLKHIKSNNEYQNIAIEKMMSAQEIADKFGIDFHPDADILSDLAVSANEQTKELTSILTDACDYKNATTEQVEFVPLETQSPKEKPEENTGYYVYSVHPHNEHRHEHHPHHNSFPPHDYAPEPIYNQPAVNHHRPEHHYNCYPFETQIPPPPMQYPPVTPNPSFYDSMMGFTPAPDCYQPFYMEPVTTTTTIILPIAETVEPEPVLVGEEYEETVTSKVTVDHDEEPGSATVNHVMTYTVSEKAHFKTPEIEKLPQQMQYTFFLM